MVNSMDTYQHLMMAPESEGSNIVACLHLLGLIWISMVPEEEGHVPPCVDRRIISLREFHTLLLVICVTPLFLDRWKNCYWRS
jgi:hypothetical protein